MHGAIRRQRPTDPALRVFEQVRPNHRRSDANLVAPTIGFDNGRSKVPGRDGGANQKTDLSPQTDRNETGDFGREQ